MARVILAASRPDDLVLDLFSGTGTTGAVAHRLRRAFHRHRASGRIRGGRGAAHRRHRADAGTGAGLICDRARAPRVPFLALLERGLVAPGINLVDAKKRHRASGSRRWRAVARPSGRLDGPHRRAGAGARACNGWTFWHVETPQGLTVIDALRARVRAEMGAD